MKIPIYDLLKIFQQMCSEKWKYKIGSAEKGCVDCSGAFVYAFMQFNRHIYHGSNTIARKYVHGMVPISEAKPGMVAFKIRQPGTSGFSLPKKFWDDKDLRDFYHIGLIDETGTGVLNASNEKDGFVRSKLRKSWAVAAWLNDVDYGKAEVDMTDVSCVPLKAVVVASTGDTVNLRKGPDKSEERIAKVPVGTELRVLDDAGTWCLVDINGKQGYMMSNYLEYMDMDPDTERALPADVTDLISKSVTGIKTAISQLESIENDLSLRINRG